MRKAISLLSFSVSLTVFFDAGALAYGVPHAYLQIDQVSDTSYVMLWKVPYSHETRISIMPVFSFDFVMEATSAPKKVTGAILYHYSLHGPLSLVGQTLIIDGLDKSIVEVIVKINYSNGEKVSLVLGPNYRKVVIPGKSTRTKVTRSSTFHGDRKRLLQLCPALIIPVKGCPGRMKSVTGSTRWV